MAAKANMSKGYRWRLAAIGLMCFLFGLYFLYDGWIGYPGHNAAIQESIDAREQLREEHADAPDFGLLWEQHARENDLLVDANEKQLKSPLDITTQYIFAVILIPIGLVFGWSWLAAGSRWVAAEEEGLRTSSGEFVPWDAVQSIDRSRWKTKGIAVVHYEKGGRPGRLKLDDWKFDRDATTAIFDEVQRHLGEEEGGEPASTDRADGTQAST
ncbi:MAG: hypothetical protein ACLFV3_02485 [Phycisphaeraceae bacterium]